MNAINGGCFNADYLYTSDFFTPTFYDEWAKDTRHRITIEEVDGTPSAASIGVEVQLLQPTARNQVAENLGGTFSAVPIWTTVTHDAYPDIVPMPLPRILADQTLGVPGIAAVPPTYFLTVPGGFIHRLRFVVAYAGGSGGSQGWKVSHTYSMRG